MPTGEQSIWKSILWLGMAIAATAGFIWLGFLSGETASGQFGIPVVVSTIGQVSSMLGANLALCAVVVCAIQAIRSHDASRR